MKQKRQNIKKVEKMMRVKAMKMNGINKQMIKIKLNKIINNN